LAGDIVENGIILTGGGALLMGLDILAIELEASFKWFPQRLLYDVVKAYRAGFPELWVVTQFRAKPGWIDGYAEEIGVKLRIVSPKVLEKEIAGIRTSSLPSGT
jgi:cell division ATPase FtsA